MNATQFGIRSNMIGETPRVLAMDAMEAWYNGNAYKVGLNARQYAWETEFVPGTEKLPKPERIPLNERRPYQYNLARYIVDRSTAWLVGGRHFPLVKFDEPVTQAWHEAISKTVGDSAIWLQHARKGGKAGTAAMVFKIVQGHPRIEHLEAKFCTPTFEPDGVTVKKLRYRLKVDATWLVANGYDLEAYGIDPRKDGARYWYQREFTPDGEVTYYPTECPIDGSVPELVIDPSPERTFEHNLGVLAVEWTRNLPGDDNLDGVATYEGVTDLFDPVNMLMSVSVRSIRKLSDPTLVIEDMPEIAAEDANDAVFAVGTSAGAVLETPGKAKLLEITGTGQEAAKAWLKELRGAIAEVSRVNESDPEKVAGGQLSGYALELMNAPLIGLVGELREQYGPAIKRFSRKRLELVAAYRAKISPTIYLEGEIPEGVINPKAPLELAWGSWFEPTPTDVKTAIETYSAAVAAGFMSLHTAIDRVCKLLGIEDIEAERKQIEKERGGDGDAMGAVEMLMKRIAERRAEQGQGAELEGGEG